MFVWGVSYRCTPFFMIVSKITCEKTVSKLLTITTITIKIRVSKMTFVKNDTMKRGICYVYIWLLQNKHKATKH